jgi:hypothetical protein
LLLSLLLLWQRLPVLLAASMRSLELALLLRPVSARPVLLLVRALLLLLVTRWPLLLGVQPLLLLLLLVILLVRLRLPLLVLPRLLLLVAINTAAAIGPPAKIASALACGSISIARPWLCITAPAICLLLLLLLCTSSCSSSDQGIRWCCRGRRNICCSCIGCCTAATAGVHVWDCNGRCMLKPKACRTCTVAKARGVSA